jgi:hypothetical protein
MVWDDGGDEGERQRGELVSLLLGEVSGDVEGWSGEVWETEGHCVLKTSEEMDRARFSSRGGELRPG